MKLRERMYHGGLLKRHKLPVPVISVGNLVLGGSGKTPTVQYIARLLQDNGYTPGVVSRGYGGQAKKACNIVSDGKNILLPPELAGDEPTFLAESLPGVPVLTGKKRYLPCKYGVEHLGVDCIILDDGFQHLGVHRDIDIVLFDSTALAGNSRIFPGGPLREPVSALKRCSCFILTGRNPTNSSQAEKFGQLLRERYHDKSLYYSSVTSLKLVDTNGLSVDMEQLGPCHAFCGIAHPDRFRSSLSGINADLTGFTSLADHASYPPAVMAKLVQEAVVRGARSLVTTEKDMVKVRSLQTELPVYAMRLEMDISADFSERLMTDILSTR